MFEELKQLIIEYIKQNGTESITGNILQGVLLEMVDELGSWAQGSQPPFANLTYVNQKLAEEAEARSNGDTQLANSINAEVLARQQAIASLAQQVTQTLSDYYKKSETMSTQEINALVTQTLDSYYTKSQTDSAIAEAINALIPSYYTKTETNSLLNGINQSVSDEILARTEGDETLRLLIQQVNASLVNYYQKSETYSKLEVNNIVNNIKQFRYQSVPTLPTASADTMGIIYLIPSPNPKTKNVKDEYITTSQTNEQGVTLYDWEQIGTTTVDLSGYSTTAEMNQAIASAIAQSLTAYYTKSETMSTQQINTAIGQAINTALSDYYTQLQTDAAITAALNNALASYYTKNEVNALLDTIRQSITAETNARTEADSALRLLIEQVSASLVNYYLKSETYSKLEVNAIVDNIKQFRYQVAASLPTPSAETMGIIYLIPAQDPKAQNIKEEYITILDESAYKWEHIGDTNIDLSGYSTTEQMNAAIASALASYYTTTQVDAMITSINTALAQKASQADLTAEVNRATQAEQANAQNITTLQDLVAFINKSFGKYDGQTVKTLSQAKAGKYVNVNGGETSASGYGISEPVTLNAGDILLVPSAQAIPATVSVVARLVDRTYQKVIVYTYTYQQANPELYATATADYDPSLVYTAIYDTTGETPVLTGWALGGTVYATLPATHEVSEQFYEPLMKQAVAAMPSTGYYIYLCPTQMTIVVSGYTATVSGGEALVVGWGIFKNITTNFVGAPGQSVLAQAFAVLFAAIDGLKAQLSNLGETKAKSIDFEESPKLCGQDMYIQGDGAPAAPVVPTMIGQEYMDLTNRKLYKAFAITNNVSDWVLIN